MNKVRSTASSSWPVKAGIPDLSECGTAGVAAILARAAKNRVVEQAANVSGGYTCRVCGDADTRKAWLGCLGRLDREPSLMPALRALEQSDQHVGLPRIGVHGAQLHRHFRLVPFASRGVVVGHALETTPGGQMFLVSASQPRTGMPCPPPTLVDFRYGDEKGSRSRGPAPPHRA